MFHIPLNIVSRKRWGAIAPISVEPLETPVNYFISTFTGSRECFSKEDCTKVVQELQMKDINNGLPDIQYNFMIGGDGTVFEGRGWKANRSKLDSVYVGIDGKSIDVAYIGPHPVAYKRNYPCLLAKLTQQRLIEYGIKNQYISPMYNKPHFTETQSKR